MIVDSVSEAFRRVEAGIRKQQNFETPLIKKLVTNLPDFKQLVPEQAGEIDYLAEAAIHDEQETTARVTLHANSSLAAFQRRRSHPYSHANAKTPYDNLEASASLKAVAASLKLL